ncbi:MAG: benzene 1,2-dioxygenase [Acidimicrobiales bacterium mtb01]|nr:Rieske 2Fe-2S domain-containing protein [Actinomycetota bacterium]TEX46653.1 MAG: benzene 1,2-dioxygenase [Acidimicrobiales bacterium mtb01]
MSEVDLGDLSDLGDGAMRVFADIGSHGVVVCRIEGRLHAFDDNCSHRDARLSDGRLRGATITCPVHGAQFDVRTGEHRCAPATSPITVRVVRDESGRAVLGD